jgi:hypothetical protein
MIPERTVAVKPERTVALWGSVGDIFHSPLDNMDLQQELERVYQEWYEAEGRAAQQRECDRICRSLPDTPAGELERQYQVLRARYSPAYFSGSSLYHGPRLLRSPAFHLQNFRRGTGQALVRLWCRYELEKITSPHSR